MDPVQRALWFVESHSQESGSLDEIARECHVSPYHITRAFAETQGIPLMRYVRARRLSEAARKLAAGVTDILPVALSAGYSSHEAFTRAFREQFALTPEQVRAQGHLENVPVTKPITMKSSPLPTLAPPRFETTKRLVLAGLVERYNCDSPAGIPDQWQRFHRYLGAIPGQVGAVAYGACYRFDDDGNFDYLACVEVRDAAVISAPLQTLVIPPQRYAVFKHEGHVSEIRAVCSAIWSQWFPISGCEADDAPTLERYGPEFNPRTGLGGFEVWVAVKSQTAPRRT